MIQISSKNACMKCKECCIFRKEDAYFAPVLSDKERVILVGKRGKAEHHFEKKDGAWQVKLESFEDKLVCPFLDTETWLCGVYEDRPFDCRTFPYIVMWDEEGKNVILGKIDDACLAYDSKPEAELENYKASLIRHLESDETIEMLINNKRLILGFDKDFIPVMILEKISERLRTDSAILQKENTSGILQEPA